MSLHKLTAGDGYTYLTRQVAAQDATQRGYAGLGDYYAQRGESPGVWMGRGADGLPEFSCGPQVTEAQMVALFGEGRHPDAETLEAELIAAGRGVPAVLAATRLGAPYRVFDGVTDWRKQLAARFEGWNAAAGLPRDWPIPEDDRARLRSELGRDLFGRQFGRPPADARELSGFLARSCRQRTTAVAGYDLTFSPVKSVSALWAVAPREVARRVEQAHQAAVADTLRWLEDNATYTRLGRAGVQQVDVHGLIAAAFTHRDSRAGDPDLHTHVAIANKVQTADGRWLALDGRPLHKMTVAASERYNTRLEAHLTASLGVRFAERAAGEPGKRPVREIVGVSDRLNRTWSARRASIDLRRAQLSVQFQIDHGRPPGPIEAVKLAQRATLETRQAKHAPRSLAEQRTSWRAEALRVLGGEDRLAAMLHAVQRRPRRVTEPAAVTPRWVAGTAETVLATVQTSRATWQEAHVRAEAERRARTAGVTLAHLDDAVERVVAAALSPAQSMPLGVAEPVSEPAALRRRDGQSVYRTAGAQLYTSPRIVAAERALIATARLRGGQVATPAAVELALLESAANGVKLNPGQAQLVRELATSGARLQLALAPAGTGKTTAMAVLAKAWTDDGGTVVGLAPSAAAAAVLGGEIGAHTDTLAKLIWSLDSEPGPHRPVAGRGRAPAWVQQIGPSTLVILDEAGMAGTAELARAVEFVVARGGSVRLIGDDQQLAAIGAGGVLRDLAEVAGAVTLSQVVRFADPAEGAASLALRAGDDAALGFYLDAGRVHVGDQSTVTDAAYTAWAADRAGGRDSVMLAPTRELVATLNARARTDRITAADDQAEGPEVQLADGSCASAGDTLITRRNDRTLAISATDWVKNGDRWTVNIVLAGGALQVTHLATRRRLTLPAGYVRAHTALGYASTVHGAQGVTADVCHTVATGAESRQLLYVAMTRGRTGNHVYLRTAGDGEAHTVITPDALLPPTAVDILSRILARDGAQTSATTQQRTLTDPAARLAGAADRYYDSLTVAAHHQLGPQRLEQIDQAAEQTRPGLGTAPAYSTLRSHLALLAADGHDPAEALTRAHGAGELSSASDPAAVLYWRLDPSGKRSRDEGDNPAGPLPWLPALPTALTAAPAWDGYLRGRDALVRDLAAQVSDRALRWTPTSAPMWASALVGRDSELLAQLAVWRAAHDVPDTDRRPTGPPCLPAAEQRQQRALNQAVAAALGDPGVAAARWAPLAASIEPRLTGDPFWPQLTDRLTAADRAGIDVTTLARTAGDQAPLPDEWPAAALWWRLSRHLSPAVLDASSNDTDAALSTLRPQWTPALAAIIGEALTRRVLADPAWPALVAAVSDATHAGWQPQQILTTAYGLLGGGHADDQSLRPDELATALVWRIGMLTDGDPWDDERTAPPPDPAELELLPPEDLHELTARLEPAALAAGPCTPDDQDWPADPEPPADVDEELPAPDPAGPGPCVPQRPDVGAGGPADTDVAWMPRDPDRSQLPGQTQVWQSEEIPRARLLELNSQALAFFVDRYRGSWGAQHLHDRLGDDLTDDPRFTPGYAPAGWTALTDHLRQLGACDRELLAAGLASTARTGKLIDRFRDRLMFPITHDQEVRGFIGRRNPDTPDAGPKYLNTPQTELFDKGGQLFGLTEGATALHAGATPVLVEGPLDAWATTLAGAGHAVGVAALGTAFTDRQADQLRPYLGAGKAGVIVATDADRAGQQAAGRAFWQLTARGANPRHLVMPDGQDPAEMLHAAGADALRDALTDPPTLARTLVDQRVGQWADRLHTAEGTVFAIRSAAEAIGALPPEHWLEHIDYLTTLVDALPGEVHLEVLDAGHAWTDDPHGQTRRQLAARSPQPTGEPPRTAQQKPARGATHTPPSQDQGAGSTSAARLTPEQVLEDWAATVWLDVGRSIDPRLVAGADWSGLAAALDRAHHAGYDVHRHLPRLAAQEPLPPDRPARALHYRLIEECEAAITPMTPQAKQDDDRAREAAGHSRLQRDNERADNQRPPALRPTNVPAGPRPPTTEPPPASERTRHPRR